MIIRMTEETWVKSNLSLLNLLQKFQKNFRTIWQCANTQIYPMLHFVPCHLTWCRQISLIWFYDWSQGILPYRKVLTPSFSPQSEVLRNAYIYNRCCRSRNDNLRCYHLIISFVKQSLAAHELKRNGENENNSDWNLNTILWMWDIGNEWLLVSGETSPLEIAQPECHDVTSLM